jgi:DNA-binding response OmpR family regulator
MPGMNGVEFIRRLRRDMPAVPVLMLTGDVTVEIDPSLGVFELIIKPVEGKELDRIVKTALHQADAKNSIIACLGKI